MKLPRIPTKEATVKSSIAMRKSTLSLLEKYHNAYERAYGVTVTRQELIEHMVLGFMADDKGFQRSLRQHEAATGGTSESHGSGEPSEPEPVVSVG